MRAFCALVMTLMVVCCLPRDPTPVDVPSDGGCGGHGGSEINVEPPPPIGEIHECSVVRCTSDPACVRFADALGCELPDLCVMFEVWCNYPSLCEQDPDGCHAYTTWMEECIAAICDGGEWCPYCAESLPVDPETGCQYDCHVQPGLDCPYGSPLCR